MIDGAFVIDAVTHGYNFAPENSNDRAIRGAQSGGASASAWLRRHPLLQFGQWRSG